MKSSQKNSTKQIIKIVLGSIALIAAVPFFMGLYAGVTAHTGTTGQIADVLEKHCECESVEIDIAAYGVQFSRKDGMTGQKAAYILKDCSIETDFATEAKRLNTILVKDVEDYKALSIVELYFKNGDKTEIATIKNGQVQ